MTPSTLTTTTTTQQWILTKYSRSRTISEPVPKRQKLTEMKKQPRPKEEFDHFAQPQLLLRLDTTRSSSPASSSSDLPITHSMTLNVYYDPHYASSQKRSGDQILTLDSLDLMSFSSPLIRTHCPPDELPLKGVYKEEVLGLRYLYVDSTAQFKRVQFKFSSTEERERFMATVQGIIPFKPAESTTKITSSTATTTNARVPAQKSTQRRMGDSISSSQGHRGSSTPSFTMGPPLTTLPSLGSSQHPVLPAISTSFLPQPSQNFPRPLSTSPSPSYLLSTRLSTLLPKLNLSTHQEAQEEDQEAVEETQQATESERLLRMESEEFEKLFEQILFEDGFEELVERVQGVVQREMGH
ncbi:uncharacterized protein JCM6883_004518 [Sporobolomyces salmoneus]|uniref:uncharacterized protein n=1 Tax=Sporobolomyces salmoneus TaxID=183962 RepID=UPI00317B826F